MKPMSRFALSLGSHEWFAKIGKKVVPLDLALQKRTKGHVSLLRMAGLPYLLLTVTGRTSGQPRSVPLLYVPHGDDYVVIGSNWGQRRHPEWSANLLAHPEAVVRERGQDIRVRARQVTGEERARLWREATAVWPAYDTYVERAGGRELRMFVLSRVS